MAREGQRYTWSLRVEDAEEPAGALARSGAAGDRATLRHELTHAVADALAHIDGHDEVVADDEDGWELRGAPPPARGRR